MSDLRKKYEAPQPTPLRIKRIAKSYGSSMQLWHRQVSKLSDICKKLDIMCPNDVNEMWNGVRDLLWELSGYEKLVKKSTKKR